MDMTNEEDLAKTVEFVKEKLGGCDTLLINAGTIRCGSWRKRTRMGESPDFGLFGSDESSSLSFPSTLTFEELLEADKQQPGHSSKAIDRVMKVGRRNRRPLS